MPVRSFVAGAVAATLVLPAAPVLAADKPAAPTLVTCEQSLGTIALVDGDLAGWTQYGLGSPRELINALATQSGCFTPHTDMRAPARFLITAVAGSQEEVDKSVELGKTVATEALVRSGAAARMAGGVPFAGAALGMFSAFGGKKKTVAAGLRVVSPANGQAIASGTGTVKKSSLTWGGGNWAATAAPGEAGAVVAVDTNIYAAAAKTSAAVRAVRAGTQLTPTGKREGLFIEVADNYGTKGWISVEDLK
jgi:hypothetical protein